jgi:Xaa-Pro aminopeptidase
VDRLERLKAWMEAEGIDATVVFGPDSVVHLCGYTRYFGGLSALVVGRDGERTLLVAFDEADVARRLADADEVLTYGERGFGMDLDPLASLVPTLAELPVMARARRVGVSSEVAGGDSRLDQAISAETVDAGDILYRLRLVKDEDELRKILRAYELCWIAQKAVGDGAVAGKQEIELFTEAQAAAQVAAGEPIEFLADLLSGPHTADVTGPIHVAGRRTIQQDDPIVADIVIRVGGYSGDSAETFAAGSHPEAEAARTELLAILENARTELVPGATGAEVFAELRRRVESTFPGGELPHHGGHAVGLTSFEDPHIIPSDTRPLEEGMVLAVEPGVYFAGQYGARVENIFVVTPQGGLELREKFEGGR